MSADLSIDINAGKSLERISTILQNVPNGTSRALSAIMQRATPKVKKVSLDGMTSVFDISKADIRNRKNTVIKTGVKKLSGGVMGYIQYTGYQIPLIRFGVKPGNVRRQRARVPVMVDGRWFMTSPGVPIKARQRKDRPFTPFKNAFVAQVGSHIGLFERDTRQGLPIREIVGASAAHMASAADVMEEAEQAVYETIDKRVEQEISRILEGYGR